MRLIEFLAGLATVILVFALVFVLVFALRYLVRLFRG